MKAKRLISDKVNEEQYPVACLTVVLKGGPNGIEVLTQRNKKGEWGLCGGHPKAGETPEQTAKRELAEESDVHADVEFLCDVKTHSRRKSPVKVFYAVVEPNTRISAGSDAIKVKWRELDDLEKLCDSDREAVDLAIKKVHDVEGIVKEAISEHPIRQVPSTLATEGVDRGTRGILVALEGDPDSTNIEQIKRAVESAGKSCSIVGYKPKLISEATLAKARQLETVSPLSEALTTAAEAMYRWKSSVYPALEKDHVVLCPRWLDGYRRECLGHGLEKSLAEMLFRWMPAADVTFYVNSTSVPQVIADHLVAELA